MPSGRLRSVFVLVGSIFAAALWGLNPAARAQQVPTYSAPPQRMAPCVAPNSSPATAPANPVYPSTYPSTNPPAYPSTSAAATDSGVQALSPYDESLPGISISPSGGANGAVQASYEDQGPLYVPYGNPDAMTAAATPTPGAGAYVDPALVYDEPWTWQILPSGLMYRSYLAGPREARFASQWVQMRNQQWMWDVTLGGRAAILRYGSNNALWPQGWELDIEGAAFPRLDLAHDRDVNSADFRFGVPLTTRRGCWEAKLAYYHLSSHLGDEYMLRNPTTYNRINYVRDAAVLGLAVYFGPNVRVYSEADWAFNTDGGAKPWEFQFGVDMVSAEPTGGWGAPFFAANCHLREANDYGGNLTVQTGWAWRGVTGHLCRFGLQYFNGFSEQGEFYNTFEEQIGIGLWYDF